LLQHEWYYKAVLLMPDKGLVKPNCLVRDSQQLLKDGGIALPDGHPEEMLMDLPDLPAALAHELNLAEIEEWGDMPEPAAPPQPVADVCDELAAPRSPPPMPQTAAPEPPSSSSSSGSSSTQGSDGDGSDAGAVAAVAFKRIRLDLPEEIEGVRIHEEVWYPEEGDHAHPPYHKLWVRCPLYKCRHLAEHDCRKARNLGEAQTRHFGRVEVVGYLGAWLSRSHDFANRAAHMKYRPSVQEIEKYLQDHGLL